MAYPLERYEETGVAFPIRVMEEASAEAMAARVMTERDREDGALALTSNPHLLYPWLYDLATSAPVLDAVEAALGPDILIWASSFFIKEAGSGEYVSWHQDATYWGLEPADILTAWIALTPSTPESGCMAVAPGTHKGEQLPHVDTFAEGNLLSRGQEIAVDVSALETADVTLRPGEMSLHHVLLAHGSEPNRSSRPRVGYTIRYIPTRVRQIGGRTCAALARGEDRHHHFDLLGRPDAALSESAWAAAREAAARVNAILMAGAESESRSASHRIGR